MSTQVEPASRAEVLRIANLMGLGEEDLEFLGKLSAESLYDFRQQLIDLYFEEDPGLRRLAKAANILPSAVIAKLTIDAIGPILAARVVGEVDTKSVVNVIKRMPVPFICDTAIQTDPRRIRPLFTATPRKISKQIADELIRRKEYVAIGQLIAYVESDVMEHALHNASDVDILMSSFMVEDKDRLGDGIAMLSDERITSLVITAGETDMWLEALDLISHLDFDEFCRVSSHAMVLDDATLDGMLTFVAKHDLWHIAIPVICLAEDPSRAVAAVLRAKPAIKKSLIAVASLPDYIDDITELVERVDDPALRKLFNQAKAA